MVGYRYSSSVFGSLRSVDQLLLAYGPQPSFDDMAWYGLAYFRCLIKLSIRWLLLVARQHCQKISLSRIYEVSGKGEFLQRSKDIFDWVANNIILLILYFKIFIYFLPESVFLIFDEETLKCQGHSLMFLSVMVHAGYNLT